MREVTHVYPICDDEPEHVTSGLDGACGVCWCDPAIKAPCGQCGGDGGPDGDCWRCGGSGLVAVEGWDDAPTVLVIHAAAGAKGRATSEAGA